jgi:hypothetical protein
MEAQPNFKALVKMADQFRKHDLPIRAIGKIKINVNENFFEPEDEADQFVENIGTCLSNLYKGLQKEFGVDADSIFTDMASEFSLDYSS